MKATSLSEGIRKMRESKGYPQVDFAILIRIPYLTLRAIEDGVEPCPDFLYQHIKDVVDTCPPYQEPPIYEKKLLISPNGTIKLPKEIQKDLGITKKNARIQMYNWDSSIALTDCMMYKLSKVSRQSRLTKGATKESI